MEHDVSTFPELGAPADIAALLAARGIESAFPIQAETIPPALDGRDICGRAPTGSGKTLAFGVPLAVRVSRARPARPRALVLAPTRELAAQIHGELAPLLALRKRSVATFYGGVGFGPQLKVLRRGVDVAVACPGRLADLVERGVMKLDEVEIVVLDEADRMADMGFLPEVRRILDKVRPNRQTLLFSATLDGDVDVIIRHYQRDPVRCEIASTEAEDDRTTHLYLDIERDQRVRATADLVGQHGATVVFCRTKHGADRLAGQLSRAGVSAVAIHGDRSQGQRERALAAFAARRVQALVATDVAARGIHVDGIGCVVHFDPPNDDKDYLHRSGRTGRAGADGVVVSFVPERFRVQSPPKPRAMSSRRQPRRGETSPARTAAARPSRNAAAAFRAADPKVTRATPSSARRGRGGALRRR
jgi:superfamily II DNA/RNA helicase